MHAKHAGQVLAQLFGSTVAGTHHGTDIEYGAGEQIWRHLRQIPAGGIPPVSSTFAPHTHD
ncbi:Uncharacterised protein [Mycobacteroides abscessus subsp. massiliense]|nr:Uncharacterised protein [Mycobacteroides abscessus subsp. massiliense]